MIFKWDVIRQAAGLISHARSNAMLPAALRFL